MDLCLEVDLDLDQLGPNELVYDASWALCLCLHVQNSLDLVEKSLDSVRVWVFHERLNDSGEGLEHFGLDLPVGYLTFAVLKGIQEGFQLWVLLAYSLLADQLFSEGRLDHSGIVLLQSLEQSQLVSFLSVPRQHLLVEEVVCLGRVLQPRARQPLKDGRREEAIVLQVQGKRSVEPVFRRFELGQEVALAAVPGRKVFAGDDLRDLRLEHFEREPFADVLVLAQVRGQQLANKQRRLPVILSQELVHKLAGGGYEVVAVR